MLCLILFLASFYVAHGRQDLKEVIRKTLQEENPPTVKEDSKFMQAVNKSAEDYWKFFKINNESA